MTLCESESESKRVSLESDDLRELKVDLTRARSLSCLSVLDLRTRKARKWVWITRAAKSLREYGGQECEDGEEETEKWWREDSRASMRRIREERRE